MDGKWTDAEYRGRAVEGVQLHPRGTMHLGVREGSRRLLVQPPQWGEEQVFKLDRAGNRTQLAQLQYKIRGERKKCT